MRDVDRILSSRKTTDDMNMRLYQGMLLTVVLSQIFEIAFIKYNSFFYCVYCHFYTGLKKSSNRAIKTVENLLMIDVRILIGIYFTIAMKKVDHYYYY